MGHLGGTQGAEPLRIELALSGDLTATLEEGGAAIAFANAEGVAALRYTGLYAYDAAGLELPARLALAHGGLAIVVDDSAAVYPIVIDPFIQQAKLTASDALAGDKFGSSIAISGSTVVVGAHLDDLGVDAGSAYASCAANLESSSAVSGASAVATDACPTSHSSVENSPR